MAVLNHCAPLPSLSLSPPLKADQTLERHDENGGLTAMTSFGATTTPQTGAIQGSMAGKQPTTPLHGKGTWLEAPLLRSTCNMALSV